MKIYRPTNLGWAVFWLILATYNLVNLDESRAFSLAVASGFLAWNTVRAFSKLEDMG